MRLRRVVILLGILFLAVASIYIYTCNFSDAENKSLGFAPNISKSPASIFDYDDVVWCAYHKPAREYESYVPSDDFFSYLTEDGEEYINPEEVGFRIIRNLVHYNNRGRIDEAELNECIFHMERLREMFFRYGKYPRRAYRNLKDGWVSSMDAPTMMVASRMLYEITRDEKWHDFVKVLSAYVVKDIDEGGFNFRLDEEAIWPLEYAEKGVSYDEAYFILNGSLYGFVGMFIIAEVEQDAKLCAYLERVGKGYEKLLPEFPYRTFTWTHYGLHPTPTICPPHYVFIEWQFLRALTHLTKNPLFEKAFAYRTACLKGVLRPQFKEIEGKTWFVIHRACAPHPYSIDCYATKIVFFDTDNREVGAYTESRIGRRDTRELFKAGEFLFGEVPQGAVRYTYVRDGWGYEIFSGGIGEPGDVVNESDATRICKYTLETANDAQLLDDGDIRIANDLSDKEEGTLICELHDVEMLDEKCFYGIEIENLTGGDLPCGLLIYDTAGTGLGRSYTPLAEGKNLVLFNILGFKEFGVTKFDDIRRIDLRIYTNDGDVEGICRMGRILRFKDLFELRDYRKKSEYEIQPEYG